MTTWTAPTASGPVRARISVPGSKSQTNRALVLAGLGDGPSRVAAPLRARDTDLMIAALRGLGTGIAETDDGLTITPGELQAATIDTGLAGTVMRFVPPLAALAHGTTAFDGDARARERPMGPLLDGLRQAGVTVEASPGDTLPFAVHGRGGVTGGVVSIDASGSSQFVSALLLAGARFDKGVEVRHVGRDPVPSLPHVAMTVAALRDRGVDVEESGAAWRVQPGPVAARDERIEPDLSNAAPFLAAALVAGGRVTVPGWPHATTQAGDALRDLLAAFGAAVHLDDDGLTVHGTGELRGLDVDLHDVGELTPVIAALAALAEGPSRLRGIGHLRGHETDRLAALAGDLTDLGATVTQEPDGLTITPARLHGGTWRAFADHRMAHAGAVLGLRVPGVVVDDITCTTKTLPDFPGLWATLLVGA